MALVNARATVILTPLEDVAITVVGAEKRMRILQRQRVPASRRRIRKAVAAPDDVPALPFIWSIDPAAQARARRWYFANKVPKGSKGGRYERTGALEKSADVQFVAVDTGGEFQLEHESGAWDYVYGDKQVPSHYLTGWPSEDNVVNTEADILQRQIIDDWYFVNTGERG